MNKSAREMFEELGYEFEPHHYSMIALIVYRKDLEYIYFDADEKIDIRGFVDMKLLQAINQQCKELGWLDDLPMHKDTYFFGYGIDIENPDEMARQVIELKEENQQLKEQLELSEKARKEAIEYIKTKPLYEEEYDYDYDDELELLGINSKQAENDLLDILNIDKQIDKYAEKINDDPRYDDLEPIEFREHINHVKEQMMKDIDKGE